MTINEAAIYNQTIKGVVNQLNIIEMLAFVGYTPEELTARTFIYVDRDGALCGVEKYDRRSDMADGFHNIGYVTDFGYLNEMKATLREFLAVL